MNAFGIAVTRSHAVAFVLGLSVSLALTMCSDVGAGPDTQSLSSVEARVAELEAALAALEGAENGTEVVYLKQEETQNGAGGSCATGSWQTRSVNTIENPYDHTWIDGPSSNQFTLEPGTYEVEALCPGHRVFNHQCKLANISSSTDTIVGTSMYSPGTYDANESSVVAGIFSISDFQTFEIQHQCQQAQGTNGFGIGANFGTEVFTMVRIKRLGD